MLILLSPSKTLDMDADVVAEVDVTSPDFLDDTNALAAIMKQKNARDIKTLMGVSDKIAQLNVNRYARFKTPFTSDNAKPAIFAFKGDVYDGFDVMQLTKAELKRAQKHLRILSGFYGLLRPLDLMQAYRLEMGIKLANPQGTSLYDFWGEKITNAINNALADSDSDFVINLASQEYFKAVKPKKLNGQLVTIDFKEKKGEHYKTIGLFAKKARGRMARFIIQKNAKKLADLEAFSEDNYRFNAHLSDAAKITFTR